MTAKTDDISDGYHTFGELYDHRRALTAALARVTPGSWRSRQHHPADDPMFEGGYFIVGVPTPDGPITYHYKLAHWDDFAAVPELEHAPKWGRRGSGRHGEPAPGLGSIVTGLYPTKTRLALLHAAEEGRLVACARSGAVGFDYYEYPHLYSDGQPWGTRKKVTARAEELIDHDPAWLRREPGKANEAYYVARLVALTDAGREVLAQATKEQTDV